jgi:molybdopterin-containing oxidoreductase family iron-sulfur binding subunit
MSASAALAVGASCSKIDRGKIVPYTKRRPGITPGIAAYYASTFQEGLVTLGVLVKTREGRPIHIEGNPEHAISRGKTGVRAIGDLLGLYDPGRLRSPSFRGKPSSWQEAGKALVEALTDASIAGKPALLLTGAIVSPTQRALLMDLKLAFPGLRHAAWEPIAPLSEISAAVALYGNPVIPRLRFDRANVILALQSDFLGSEAAAPVFIQDFAARRVVSQPTDAMNRLWVAEGGMSLTGSNADQRLQVRPSKMAALAFALARLLNETHSIPLPPALKAEDLRESEPERAAAMLGVSPSVLKLLAADLARAREAALVLAGPALPPETHVACRLLNAMLGAEGKTVETNAPMPAPELLTFAGLRDLLMEAARGEFALGIFWDTNPAYAFPDASVWKNAIAKIPDSFRIGLYEDETALDCAWRLPEHHWLESWGDFESAPDFVSLRQPAIGAVHDTRQARICLLMHTENEYSDCAQFPRIPEIPMAMECASK